MITPKQEEQELFSADSSPSTNIDSVSYAFPTLTPAITNLTTYGNDTLPQVSSRTRYCAFSSP